VGGAAESSGPRQRPLRRFCYAPTMRYVIAVAFALVVFWIGVLAFVAVHFLEKVW
jgi:hypothetical protein